jgi:hypothetical protein
VGWYPERVRWLGFVMMLVACGRIGFDPIGGGGDDGVGSGDGAVTAGDGSDCPPVCARCTGSTCVIDVTAGGAVVCPPGWSCDINCNSASACRNGIDCTMATSCNIDCNSSGSCQGAVMCGVVSCTMYCRADNTCNNSQFTCSASCPIKCCAPFNQTCSGLSGGMPEFFATCPPA